MDHVWLQSLGCLPQLGPGQFLGSFAINSVCTTHLVISPVIKFRLLHPRKKERQEVFKLFCHQRKKTRKCSNFEGKNIILCPLHWWWIATETDTLAVRGVSDVGQAPGPVIGNRSTGGWFGILGGTHEKDCVAFMSRFKTVSGLLYKIIIESWNTHASSSSQEALLCKAAA